MFGLACHLITKFFDGLMLFGNTSSQIVFRGTGTGGFGCFGDPGLLPAALFICLIITPRKRSTRTRTKNMMNAERLIVAAKNRNKRVKKARKIMFFVPSTMIVPYPPPHSQQQDPPPPSSPVVLPCSVLRDLSVCIFSFMRDRKKI